MSDQVLADLSAALAPLRQDTPAADVPRPEGRIAVWVTPELVGEVVYSEMTHNGTLRAPRWRGLRTDKTIADLR
jgi:bifunctional non-homologous end joining protein LigD